MRRAEMDRCSVLRRAASLLAVVVAASATTGILADTAGSAPVPPVQTVTITKVVTGPAPPGVPYTVHIDCEPGSHMADTTVQGNASIGFTIPITVVGDATGECTFTETGTAGAASTSGACTTTATAVCSGGGTAPVVLTFTNEAFAATVTFTNTFPAASTTTTTAAPPVVAGPRFTG
jgi:hypothetical protein